MPSSRWTASSLPGRQLGRLDFGVRGYLTIKSRANPGGIFRQYAITGALTDNGTWVAIPISHVVGNGTIPASEVLDVVFTRTGDKGDAGATGATGPAGPGGGSTFANVSKLGSDAGGRRSRLWTRSARYFHRQPLPVPAATLLVLRSIIVTNTSDSDAWLSLSVGTTGIHTAASRIVDKLSVPGISSLNHGSLFIEPSVLSLAASEYLTGKQERPRRSP